MLNIVMPMQARRSVSKAALWQWLAAVITLAALCGLALWNDAPPRAASRATPFRWVEQTAFAPRLPSSIRVFAGAATNDDGMPVRAWFVDINYNDATLAARPALSDAPSGKETASSTTSKAGGTLAVCRPPLMLLLSNHFARSFHGS